MGFYIENMLVLLTIYYSAIKLYMKWQLTVSQTTTVSNCFLPPALSVSLPAPTLSPFLAHFLFTFLSDFLFLLLDNSSLSLFSQTINFSNETSNIIRIIHCIKSFGNIDLTTASTMHYGFLFVCVFVCLHASVCVGPFLCITTLLLSIRRLTNSQCHHPFKFFHFVLNLFKFLSR